MGKPTGFLEYERTLPPRRPVGERVKDYRDVYLPLPVVTVREQAARCMDCGVPFCQGGCPLGNVIPDWNDLVYRGRWEEAYRRLRATNNFPEFTGRICPAPCESACVLGVTDPPVTIERIEQEIAEAAYRGGWAVPRPPEGRTGRRVAVVGSGPAGLACADQLNAAGHLVTVFERHARVGGLLRFGIPDFKLEKDVLDRRLAIMEAEGVRFRTGVDVGRDVTVEALRADFDAVVLCAGATQPRNLPVPGRDLGGVHFAWDYLSRQNDRVAGVDVEGEEIHAAGRHVVVIGGGDTGSDCVGTANRQGAASVTQFELFAVPPEDRPAHQPWPFYPMTLRTSSSHEEGAERRWSIQTTAFEGSGGRVERLRTVAVRAGASGRFETVPGTEETWAADLVLLAIGYVGPERGPLVEGLGTTLTERGLVATDDAYATDVPGVFAAGDCRRGQSLVVWAISEGREAARAVDGYLVGETRLPTKGVGDLPFIR